MLPLDLRWSQLNSKTPLRFLCDSSQVEVSQYLADLRLEDEAARSANMHVTKPGQYQFIKESLDVEEAKHNKAASLNSPALHFNPPFWECLTLP